MASAVSKRLTRLTVIETAEALVDRDGWQRLTMTGLAGKLGVRVPSLYTHVDSAEEVLAQVQIRAHAMLAARLQRAAMGKTGERAFRALAAVLRDFAGEHGGLYDLAMQEAIDPRGVGAASEPSGAALTAVIESFGIEAPTLDHVMNCLATLHGVIVLDRAGVFGSGVDPSVAFERAVAMVVAQLQVEGAGSG